MKNINNIRVKFDFNPGPVSPSARPIAYFNDGVFILYSKWNNWKYPLIAEVVTLPASSGKLIGVNFFPLSTDTGSVGCVDISSDAYKMLVQALLYTNNYNKHKHEYQQS